MVKWFTESEKGGGDSMRKEYAAPPHLQSVNYVIFSLGAFVPTLVFFG